MKQNLVIMGIWVVLLLIFGTIWGSLDMYDTPEANKFIFPFWMGYVASCLISLFIIKKYVD